MRISLSGPRFTPEGRVVGFEAVGRLVHVTCVMPSISGNARRPEGGEVGFVKAEGGLVASARSSSPMSAASPLRASVSAVSVAPRRHGARGTCRWTHGLGRGAGRPAACGPARSRAVRPHGRPRERRSRGVEPARRRGRQAGGPWRPRRRRRGGASRRDLMGNPARRTPYPRPDRGPARLPSVPSAAGRPASELVPLHIFEERFKELIARCESTGRGVRHRLRRRGRPHEGSRLCVHDRGGPRALRGRPRQPRRPRDPAVPGRLRCARALLPRGGRVVPRGRAREAETDRSPRCTRPTRSSSARPRTRIPTSPRSRA